MAKDIVIQGERYANVAELNEAIEKLEEQLDGMPSDTPEHSDLQRHVERMRETAEAFGSATDEPLHSSASDAEPEAEAVEGEDENEPQTTSLREASETGAQLVCPTCGQQVPFPEVPPMDQTVERCPNCDGWGKVVTPSRVDGLIWRDCVRCNGNGFIDKASAPVYEQPRKSAPVPEAPGATWSAETEDWNPPQGAQPPWTGAIWDRFYGKWS